MVKDDEEAVLQKKILTWAAKRPTASVFARSQEACHFRIRAVKKLERSNRL